MKTKLFHNILLLIFINILIKPLWIFGVDLKVQNISNTANFGLYYITFNTSFIFSILLDFGLNQFNNREVAKDSNFLSLYFNDLFVLKFLLALLYLGATFILSYTLNLSAEQNKILLFLAFNQILLSFILYARSNFTALEYYKIDSFFSVFDKVMSLIICFFLLYTPLVNHFKIIQFVYAQFGALLISCVAAFAFIYIKFGIKKPQFRFRKIIDLLKQAAPYAFIVFLMIIYSKVDVLMLSKLNKNGALESGIYASGYRLLDALNMIPFLLASILIPFFTKQFTNKQDYTEVLNRAQLFFIALCVPFIVFVILFGKELLSLMYVQSNVYWQSAFTILLLCFPWVFFKLYFWRIFNRSC
ncbi:MAG: oligosaccharide flippase family protein [Chitinophagales bacterium]|nr:oligosaccharide flippase family protein [Chitinophagales bacterium]